MIGVGEEQGHRSRGECSHRRQLWRSRRDHGVSSSHVATAMCPDSGSTSNPQARVWAIVHMRTRSRSRPSSALIRSRRCRTAFRLCPSSRPRTIEATPNSRSPASGSGSIRSHGSRSAASTLSACRSWFTSTCSPCVSGGVSNASVAASISRSSTHVRFAPSALASRRRDRRLRR